MNPEDLNPEDVDNEDDSELDLGDVPEDTGKREYKLVPKGKNTLFILDWEKCTSGSGNPQLEITFGNEEGLKFKEWFSLLPTAIWRIAGLAMAVDPEILPGTKLKLNKQKLISRRFIGTVKHEKNGDYVNCKITKFEPHPEGPIGDDLPF